MSVTTTQNPVAYSTLSVLADYDLHHSGEAGEEGVAAPSPHPVPAHEEPANWDDSHRRVPEYRPINRELDLSERRVYNNGVERAFITVMLHGVWLQAVRTQLCMFAPWLLTTPQSLSSAWRATGGRISDNVFKYKIGGEW